MRPLNETENLLIVIVMGIAFAGIIYAAILARQILGESKGSSKMQQVWGYIKDGANAYLRSQFRIIAVLVAVLVVVLFFSVYLINPTPYAIEHFCPEVADAAREGIDGAAIRANVAAQNPNLTDVSQLTLLQENAVVYAEEAAIVSRGILPAPEGCDPARGTIANVRDRLNVPPDITSFVCAMGAKINMDGTALMQAVATVFLAQFYAIELSGAQQASIVFTAVFSAIGSPGIPSGGMVMLVIVLRSVGVPAEGIAMILAVDRILDMCRTVVNVTGDAAVAVAVAGTEGKR